MLKRLLSILITLGVLQGMSGLQDTLAATDGGDADPSGRARQTDSRFHHASASFLTSTEGIFSTAEARHAAEIVVHPTRSTALNPGESLWLAERQGQPAGAALVTPTGPHVASIGVQIPAFPMDQGAVLEPLLAVVLHHCRNQGQLKVDVQGVMEPQMVRDIAAKYGFIFNRQQTSAEGGIQLQFYTNLYFQPRTPRRNEPV